MSPQALRRVVTQHPWVLAGDVGGTKISLASFILLDGGLQVAHEQIYQTAQYASFEAVLREFLQTAGELAQTRPAAACFGMAGVVEEGRCQPVNYPWIIDQQKIRAALDIDRVELLNDLQATAYGCLDLTESNWETINEGRTRSTPNTMAVIAAGTGLGEALLHRIGSQWHPIASEGGHAGFAPSSELEEQMLTHLRGIFEQVSYDLLLSGRGIRLMYEFLRDVRGLEEPAWLSALLSSGRDPAAVITDGALSQRAPICEQTLELFVRIYGNEAGNLALKALATGGVLIGGGIAPRILPFLRRPAFMNGFTAKSRLADFMRGIPVRVLLDSRRALWGAASYALRMAQEQPVLSTV